MHLFRLNDSQLMDPKNCFSQQTLYADDIRLFLIGFAGSAVAILSLLENLILFYVFSTSRKLRRQNYANPVFLAFFDILVSSGYLLMESMHFFAYRLQSASLVLLWAKYMRVVYCVQHFALTVSNFLLVIASLERYLANGPLYTQRKLLVWIVSHKPIVIILVICLAMIFKVSIYWENTTVHLPQCAPIDSVVPIWVTAHTPTQQWYQAWRFWLRKTFTIIVPFLLLLYCNFYIVQRLRRQRKRHLSPLGEEPTETAVWPPTTHLLHNLSVKLPGGKKLKLKPSRKNCTVQNEENSPGKLMADTQVSVKSNTSTSNVEALPRYSLAHSSKLDSPTVNYEDKRGVRVATRTLVMVVGCYLIANSMTTVLNIWEYFDVEFLRYRHYFAYLIASDLAALLTIFGCALRLPIYFVNDKRIRKAICRALLRCRYFHRLVAGGGQQLRELAEANHLCEKWSIVIVSNSLRSNLTGMLSQVDLATFTGKRSFDQLAILVQNRRSFLVQMTINLGSVRELNRDTNEEHPNINKTRRKITGDGESATYLTDIQEEDEDQMSEKSSMRNSHNRLSHGSRSKPSYQRYFSQSSVDSNSRSNEYQVLRIEEALDVS
ncbi:7 transmembrane receptor (rhodopsin family) domain-containing protein [Ditylenchus destructor]|nr:7 transmembrane receptor (rhodopsin family) domain-containing protein [Ditylenchus destructor]